MTRVPGYLLPHAQSLPASLHVQTQPRFLSLVPRSWEELYIQIVLSFPAAAKSCPPQARQRTLAEASAKVLTKAKSYGLSGEGRGRWRPENRSRIGVANKYQGKQHQKAARIYLEERHMHMFALKSTYFLCCNVCFTRDLKAPCFPCHTSGVIPDAKQRPGKKSTCFTLVPEVIKILHPAQTPSTTST